MWRKGDNVNLAIATMPRARHRLPRAQVGRVKMSLLLVMVLAYSPVATAMADGPSAAGQASSSGEPALCRDVSAAAVSAIVGRRLPPATGYTGTSGTNPGITVEVTFCTYGALASAFATEGTIEFSYGTWSKAVSLSLLKANAEYNPNFTRIALYSGLGVAALYMAGKIITGPDATKRMPIEVIEAFRGKRVVGTEVNWDLSVAKLACLEKLAIDEFLRRVWTQPGRPHWPHGATTALVESR
jgi:hypothetical protein